MTTSWLPGFSVAISSFIEGVRLCLRAVYGVVIVWTGGTGTPVLTDLSSAVPVPLDASKNQAGALGISFLIGAWWVGRCWHDCGLWPNWVCSRLDHRACIDVHPCLFPEQIGGTKGGFQLGPVHPQIRMSYVIVVPSATSVSASLAQQQAHVGQPTLDQMGM